jgi:hypothetical protein
MTPKSGRIAAMQHNSESGQNLPQAAWTLLRKTGMLRGGNLCQTDNLAQKRRRTEVAVAEYGNLSRRRASTAITNVCFAGA